MTLAPPMALTLGRLNPSALTDSGSPCEVGVSSNGPPPSCVGQRDPWRPGDRNLQVKGDGL